VIATTVLLEVERAEREHETHAHALALENDRIELERAQERGWSKEEVQRLALQLAETRKQAAP